MRVRIAQWSEKGVSLVERAIPRSDRVHASTRTIQTEDNRAAAQQGCITFPRLIALPPPSLTCLWARPNILGKLGLPATIGQTIYRYRIREKLGGDGIGVVDKAGDRFADEPVASRATEWEVGAGRTRVRLRMVHS
jgi:hypothetical protein